MEFKKRVFCGVISSIFVKMQGRTLIGLVKIQGRTSVGLVKIQGRIEKKLKV
jgi:hypothetical protein